LLPTLTPTDFVAVLNQTLETAYPHVVIEGELSNFRISKNRWVYFDLKDDHASVKFFGTVYSLPGPLEEGMLLKVSGSPRLHPLFGFSVNFQTIELSGEGTIKKAFELLLKKLTLEGLFDDSRKRRLPYPPQTIGLITSRESAAYADFTKIINARWPLSAVAAVPTTCSHSVPRRLHGRWRPAAYRRWSPSAMR
jgi:exodeoxyribonuclease VII large subunit